MDREAKVRIVHVAFSALLLLVSLFPMPGWSRLALCLLAWLPVGLKLLQETVEGIVHREPVGEAFLMTTASLGAFLLGEYFEAVLVVLLFSLGEFLEDLASDRSRDSVRALLSLRPDSANLLSDLGEITVVKPEEITAGSMILVRPGERVPLDGVVFSGSGELDTASLTGESIPREVREGDTVLGGFVNLSTPLIVKTSGVYGESVAARILKLIEESPERKGRSRRLLDRFARYYTPAVCLCALALMILPPCVRILLGMSGQWSSWFYRGLTVLVAGCPCAVVISVPLTFFAAVGGAGRQGILMKGADVIENLADADTVCLDKTGTLTDGRFTVTGYANASLPSYELRELAAHAELYSVHPVALSLREGLEMNPERVSDVEEHGGMGITAHVDGHLVSVGNGRLVSGAPEIEHPGTLVHVALDGNYVGSILFEDKLKPGAREALEKLADLGLRHRIMLTGDRESAAASVAGRLGIREWRSGLLPLDKVAAVREAQDNGKVIFLGDGLNDAPVLKEADVGVAMGAFGSEGAIEAADAVLMRDDPAQLCSAIRRARRCMRIVRENLIFALFIKLCCLLLGAFGVTGIWLAVFADTGVMLLCVLNAVRAMR